MASTDLVIDRLDTSTIFDLFTTGDIDRPLKFSLQLQDPAEVSARINAQKLAAKSIEELLGGGEVESSKTYLNRPFNLLGVDWQLSDIEGGEGLPFYAVLHGADPQGESVTITTGSKNIIRDAVIMVHNGWLPAPVKITSEKTAAGYTVLSLALAPEIKPF